MITSLTGYWASLDILFSALLHRSVGEDGICFLIMNKVRGLPTILSILYLILNEKAMIYGRLLSEACRHNDRRCLSSVRAWLPDIQRWLAWFRNCRLFSIFFYPTIFTDCISLPPHYLRKSHPIADVCLLQILNDQCRCTTSSIADARDADLSFLFGQYGR